MRSSVRRAAVLVSALLAATPAAARAQDSGDFAAYVALTVTPVGALPQVPVGADSLLAARRFDVLYGQTKLFGTIHNFGVGYSERRGPTRMGATVGVTTCEDCDNILMGGIELERLLDRRTMADGGVASISLAPRFGIATPLDSEGDALFLSASLGLPIVYTSGGPGWRVSFYGTPGAGWGRISGEFDSEQGLRPMFGAGMRATSPSGNGLVVGAQHVFIDGAETQIGFAISIAVGGGTR